MGGWVVGGGWVAGGGGGVDKTKIMLSQLQTEVELKSELSLAKKIGPMKVTFLSQRKSNNNTTQPQYENYFLPCPTYSLIPTPFSPLKSVIAFYLSQ